MSRTFGFLETQGRRESGRADLDADLENFVENVDEHFTAEAEPEDAPETPTLRRHSQCSSDRAEFRVSEAGPRSPKSTPRRTDDRNRDSEPLTPSRVTPEQLSRRSADRAKSQRRPTEERVAERSSKDPSKGVHRKRQRDGCNGHHQGEELGAHVL